MADPPDAAGGADAGGVHFGRVPVPDLCGAAGNPACADVLRLRLEVRGGRVTDAGFSTTGSVHQQRAADALCRLLVGRTLAEAACIAPADVLATVDLPERHRHAAHVAVDALQDALRDAPPAA